MLPKRQFPREGGMLLYRGLVKDQVNSSRSNTMVRKHISSCERERMRVLEILSLLPDPKQGRGKQLNHEKKKNRKKSSSSRSIVSKSTSASITVTSRQLSRSPYKVTKPNSLKKCQKTRKSHNLATIQKHSSKESIKSKRLLPRDNEYIWHPIVIEDPNKKVKIVSDVMKHYQSQYHKR